MQTKRLLSAFLALVMVMSMVTVPVSAEDTITSCTKTTGCTLADGHLEECSVPEEQPIGPSTETPAENVTDPVVCSCENKCEIEAKNAQCAVCCDASDTLSEVCKGAEPVYEACETEGCDLVKGHPGDHTGAGNFVACDGNVTPDTCEATAHIPGCTKFSVVNETTLNAAIAANMTEITLAEGFVITGTVVIPAEKTITLDMAGKKITIGANVNPAIRVLGKLTVKNGDMDTATGEDADGYCFIVGDTETAGELTIESGSYHGAATEVSVTKGTAYIQGGTYSAEAADNTGDTRYVLNCYDANYQAGTASIQVTGGSFHDFDPMNNKAEGENTSFVPDGYCVGQSETAYVVDQHVLTKVSAVDATCTVDGNIEHWTCGNCKYLYDAAENGNELTADQVAVKDGPHKLSKQAAVAATCQDEGNIEHWKCDICNLLFDAAENGNKLTADQVAVKDGPHKLSKQAAVAATCQDEGNIEHWKCDVCGKLFDAAENGNELTEEQVVVSGGPHDLKYQGGKLATYDADGIHPHYYCEVTGCGEKFEDARGETPFEGSTVITMLSHVEDGVLVVDEDAIANEGKKNVVLDLLQKDVMGSLTAVTEVQFQKACLEDHVDRGGTLWVYLSDGQVYFDNDALDTIVNKAEGSTVTLLVDEITKTDSGLTAKQKTTLNGKKDPYIVRLQLTSGGKRITADFDGKVYVYLTEFEPKTGYKNSNYSAFFLDEDGTTDAVSYYSRDARITVEHFSEYFLARNVKAASNPTTGDTSNVMVWAGVGLAAVAALVVLLILNRKKKAE